MTPSTLTCLAENLRGVDGIICPVMDARRGQVYSATFKCDGETVTRLTPDRAISISDLAKELSEYAGESIYLSGDGYEVAYKGITNAGVILKKTPELLINENAYSVARVAYRKYLSGEAVTDREISATYLRLPQAERERLERLNKEN